MHGMADNKGHKMSDGIVGQQGATWIRRIKVSESWRTLAEGYRLQWKDVAQNRAEWSRQICMARYLSTQPSHKANVLCPRPSWWWRSKKELERQLRQGKLVSYQCLTPSQSVRFLQGSRTGPAWREGRHQGCQREELAVMVWEIDEGTNVCGLLVDWLVASRPSNLLVYLRDGSAQTMLHAVTLRQNLQIIFSVSLSHCILTTGKLVPALTL